LTPLSTTLNNAVERRCVPDVVLNRISIWLWHRIRSFWVNGLVTHCHYR
jgi:hypothetical protein